MAIKTELEEILETTELRYDHYAGQTLELRKVAEERYGDEVAGMTISEIEKKFAEDGLLPVCLSVPNKCRLDRVFIVPRKILEDSIRLDR